MTARFPMISSPRGHSIDADTDAILVLEHIDLLAVDRTVRPASIVYRVIAKLPAAFVEYDGRRQTKDRWAFEIWCDLRYPRTNPVVRLDRGVDVPDNEFFQRGSLFPVFVKGLMRFSGSRVAWRPPAEIKDMLKRPADCALSFLWTVNREEMARSVERHATSFFSEPLKSHGVVQYLRNSERRRQPPGSSPARVPSERMPPDPVAPALGDPSTKWPDSADEEVASHRDDDKSSGQSEQQANGLAPTERIGQRKKFAIRREEQPDNVVESEMPTRFRILTTPSSPARTAETSGISHPLFMTASAWGDIREHVAWGRSTLQNINEQGGVLIGLRCREPGRGREFVVVTGALAAQSDSRSSVYVKFDHAAWSEILGRVDAMKEGRIADTRTSIVGWYHTHPNGLDCFMSGTDRTTQQSIFHRNWNFSLVLNPHRRIMACFVGARSQPCAAAIVDTDQPTSAPAAG